MTDPQLSLLVTERIDPRDQVRLMPGTDAVCECCQDECLWPFCKMPPSTEQENDA
jgi:hypothetical protein